MCSMAVGSNLGSSESYVSLCLTMSHYVSLCLTMSHYVSLCLTMSHYVSLCLTMSHYVSLCLTMSHYVSLCLTMSHYVSLCLTMSHYVSLCLTMSHYVSLCLTMSHYVSLCLTMSLCLTAFPMLQVAKVPNSEEICLHHLHIVMGWIRLVWPHVMLTVGMSNGCNCSTSTTQIATYHISSTRMLMGMLMALV